MIYYIERPDGTRKFRVYKNDLYQNMINFLDPNDQIEIEATGFLAGLAELSLDLFDTVPLFLAEMLSQKCKKEIEIKNKEKWKILRRKMNN